MSLSDDQSAGQFALKVYDTGNGVDTKAIINILGNLYAGSCYPYNDGSETCYVMLRDKRISTIEEAVRRLNRLGYETDEG